MTPSTDGRASLLPFYAWYASAGCAMMIIPWWSQHLSDLGLSSANVAGILISIPLGRLLAAPLWGWVADRWSSMTVLRIASVATALIMAVIVVVRSPEWMGPLVLLWSVCMSPWNAIVDSATVQRVGRRYGQVRVAASILFAIGVGIAGIWHDRWALAPIAMSLAGIVLATTVSFGLPEGGRAPRAPTRKALQALAGHRWLQILLAVSVLHGMTLAAYDVLFALHIQQLGGSSSMAGLAFTTGVVVEIGLFLAAPRVVATLGVRGLLWLGVGAGIPRFLLTGAFTSVTWAVAAQALHGLHFGAFWLAATTLFAERAPPELRVTTQTLLPAALAGAGPLLGTSLASWWLSWASISSYYLLMAGCSALALLLAMAVPPDDAPAH